MWNMQSRPAGNIHIWSVFVRMLARWAQLIKTTFISQICKCLNTAGFPCHLKNPRFFLESSRTGNWKFTLVLEIKAQGPGKSWKNILENHASFHWLKWKSFSARFGRILLAFKFVVPVRYVVCGLRTCPGKLFVMALESPGFLSVKEWKPWYWHSYCVKPHL